MMMRSLSVWGVICVWLAACPLSAADAPLTDKTLVAWVLPANLTQRGGSVVTVDDGAGHFDGVVFGELTPGKWMAGSDGFRRSERQQGAWPAETADAKTLVQVAVVYQNRQVTTYRQGTQYSRHTIEGPQPFGEGSVLLIGPRHVGVRQYFAGEVADVRVFNRVLSPEELQALRPGQSGKIEPWSWWTFEGDAPRDRTGRFPHVRLTGKTKVAQGRLVLAGDGGLYAAASAELTDEIVAARFGEPPAKKTPSEDQVLNYHLMHPGRESLPGDPNAAFALDGVYHLHYILAHPWRDRTSFSFVHVTSPDLLHWTWQPTRLQPAFTGHGMFSGTGFLTKTGQPAVIYHGESSGRNQIAIAKDRRLSDWDKPYPVEVLNKDGTPAQIRHWDPDCFLIGDTYYGFSGGENPPLFKSKDLKTWTLVGDFLRHDLPDVALGEDVSCGNFFKLGDQWMLLCISHPLGCRYYLGDWDAQAEQFVPRRHGRMNWRRESQSLFGMPPWRVDFFAPESLHTPDGRRVMWAWLATIGMNNGHMSSQTIQSLPRELSLGEDGALQIKPLRELETLRTDRQELANVEIRELTREVVPTASPAGTVIAQLGGDSCEIRVVIAREQARRKLCGLTLFSDGQGGGLPILLRPETGMLRVGTTEAPFAVADLPDGQDVELRIFVDKYLVEVFANDRQAMVASYPGFAGRHELRAFTVGAPTTLKSVEIWKVQPTNQGFREAQQQRVWEPATE